MAEPCGESGRLFDNANAVWIVFPKTVGGAGAALMAKSRLYSSGSALE